MSLRLYCAFEFQRGTAPCCISNALLKFLGVRELLHRVCHEIVMHRVNVGTSCGLRSLRVWAFTIRTSSVSITWELVRKAIIHSTPTESELLGWTQLSLSSHTCLLGGSVAPSSLKPAVPVGCGEREIFLMLFWVKEGNMCLGQEICSPEESRDDRVQTTEIQKWRPKVLLYPIMAISIYFWETLSCVHRMPSVTAVVYTGRPEDLG